MNFCVTDLYVITTQKPQQHVDLSAPEMELLQKFAESRGMTVEEAASYASSEELKARYLKVSIGMVCPFRRKK